MCCFGIDGGAEDDEQEVIGAKERVEREREREWGFGFGSMGRGLVRGAIRGWKASGSVCGNRTLTTCRAVILPRFGGPEVTPYSRGLYVELGSCDLQLKSSGNIESAFAFFGPIWILRFLDFGLS